MKRSIPPFSVLAATLAFLLPLSAGAAGGEPMRTIPCAMDGLTLAASGNEPVVCWSETGDPASRSSCMKLEPGYKASAIEKPRASPVWIGPVAEAAPGKACLGADCRPYGPKLEAAIAAAGRDREPDDPLKLQATADLKSVVISNAMFGGSLWSIAKDAEIKLTPPPFYTSRQDKPIVVDLEVAGNLVAVSWSNCAGPCTRFSIVTSSGAATGASGEGSGRVLQLDDKRFAILGDGHENGRLLLFDAGTAAPRGVLEEVLGDTFEAVRISGEELLVMYPALDGFEIARIYAGPGMPTPNLMRTNYLPRCEPPPLPDESAPVQP